jgi:glycosyltransferase involved in cell wall biosynthesis
MPERSVLHVLPHPGGGADTYVDLLAGMDGYRMERFYLAPTKRPGAMLPVRAAAAALAARKHELVHAHGEAAAALTLPAIALRPSVVTLHGLHLVRRLDGLAREAARQSLRLVVRAATRTICVSESERRQLTLAVGDVADRRAVVIRNGVALPAPVDPAERAAARAELGLAEHDAAGIWVGSLEPHKDPLTAARAAQRAEVTVLFVGDGSLAGALQARAGAHVRPLGRRDDVGRLLAAADFFVLSSLREGLSLALLEALAAGLPAVVSDLPENLEAIGDGGIAVPAGDEERFAAAYRRFAGDAAERLRQGAAARFRVAESFGADAMVESTRELYDVLLAAGRS